MAHFAKIDENNIVQQVIVVSDKHAPDPYPQSEVMGKQFIEKLGLTGNWLQTSYNGSFRKNYAGIGFVYNTELDAFIPPQPYQSWLLDTETATWYPPVAPPTDTDNIYTWSEIDQNWIIEE
jgi:hypothetical protein